MILAALAALALAPWVWLVREKCRRSHTHYGPTVPLGIATQVVARGVPYDAVADWAHYRARVGEWSPFVFGWEGTTARFEMEPLHEQRVIAIGCLN